MENGWFLLKSVFISSIISIVNAIDSKFVCDQRQITMYACVPMTIIVTQCGHITQLLHLYYSRIVFIYYSSMNFRCHKMLHDVRYEEMHWMSFESNRFALTLHPNVKFYFCIIVHRCQKLQQSIMVVCFCSVISVCRFICSIQISR